MICFWIFIIQNGKYEGKIQDFSLHKYIEQDQQKDFIFLTLTTPNVSKEDLENEIKHYNQSFRRLSNRTKFKKVVKGYVRKLEITYNKNRDDYHPHFHILIAVNKSYFKDTKSYISQSEWLTLWRDVTVMPEITQVFVHNKSNYFTL